MAKAIFQAHETEHIDSYECSDCESTIYADVRPKFCTECGAQIEDVQLCAEKCCAGRG